MSDQQKDSARSELNPALRDRKDETYDTRQSTPPPAESASVHEEEGRAWPIVWLVVTILCVLVALYIFLW